MLEENRREREFLEGLRKKRAYKKRNLAKKAKAITKHLKKARQRSNKPHWTKDAGKMRAAIEKRKATRLKQVA